MINIIAFQVYQTLSQWWLNYEALVMESWKIVHLCLRPMDMLSLK